MWEAMWKWFSIWTAPWCRTKAENGLRTDLIEPSGSEQDTLQQRVLDGSGNVLVGQAAGAVHITHVTHQHFYGDTAGAPAANEGRRQVTEAQKQALALMRCLDKQARIRVLDFMRREFETALVIELAPGQVHRLRCYVEVVLSNESKESA
ncbi:MAG: hypothetical protein E2582_04965 [Delftia sp.]|nr:hypothetical protein [Delftia sp.]